MHSYLRAIGFSQLKSQMELDNLIEDILDHSTYDKMVMTENRTMYAEVAKEFAPNMGIALRGEYDDKGVFRLENYFPYYVGSTLSTKEEVTFNKKVDSNSYTGMCDDVRVGVSLIFYLQNVLEYLGLRNRKRSLGQGISVMLSALSLEGKILLGIDKKQKGKKSHAIEAKKRNQLLAQAREGNQEAIDSLTIDDIDLFASVNKRTKNEDIYSIVDSTFVPYGSESDNYLVIGTILAYRTLVNSHTKEEIYNLVLECNELRFELCIAKKDLLGEPEVGRRFKGIVWMQGTVNFEELYLQS